jgi:hypothetical protein
MVYQKTQDLSSGETQDKWNEVVFFKQRVWGEDGSQEERSSECYVTQISKL